MDSLPSNCLTISTSPNIPNDDCFFNVDLDFSLEKFFIPEHCQQPPIPPTQMPTMYPHSSFVPQLPEDHPMVTAQLHGRSTFSTPNSCNYSQQSFYKAINAENAVESGGEANYFNPEMFYANGESKLLVDPEIEQGDGSSSRPMDDMGLSDLCGGFATDFNAVGLPQSQNTRPLFGNVDPVLVGFSSEVQDDRTYPQATVTHNHYMGGLLRPRHSDYSTQPNANGKRARSHSPQPNSRYAQSECSSNSSDLDYVPDDDGDYIDDQLPPSNSGSRYRKKTKTKESSLTLLGPAKVRRLKAQEALKEQTVVQLRVPPGPSILNWSPPPYTGPQGISLGTANVTNAYNEPITYHIYDTVPPHGLNGEFHRTPDRGYLDPNILFNPQKMHDFITSHPLGRNLLFRVEKRCVWSGVRYSDAYQHTCRSQNCLVSPHKRTIREGQFRIAVDEVWGRIPRGQKWTNDPFFVACYFHVECFEHLTDIGQLARWAMLRSFPRVDIPGEPRTSKTEPNRLCLSEKIDNCFKRFCRKLYDDPTWNAYNINVVEKLSTQLWLTNVRKGKTSLGVKPTQLPTEQAKKLIQNKGPDPGWGGSRFTGIKVADAEKVVALGAKEKLKGSAHNVREDNKRAVDEINALQNVDDFSDGEEWEVSVFGLEKRGLRQEGKQLQYCTQQGMDMWQQGIQQVEDVRIDPGFFSGGTIDPQMLHWEV